MGGALAELLVLAGVTVTLITPATEVSCWTSYTADRHRIQSRLMQLGVSITTGHGVTSFEGSVVTMDCVYTQQQRSLPCRNLLTVTCRTPQDSLYRTLKQTVGTDGPGVSKIGDCDAPSIIATAVFAGHRYVRELEENNDKDNPMRYDRVFFET